MAVLKNKKKLSKNRDFELRNAILGNDQAIDSKKYKFKGDIKKYEKKIERSQKESSLEKLEKTIGLKKNNKKPEKKQGDNQEKKESLEKKQEKSSESEDSSFQLPEFFSETRDSNPSMKEREKKNAETPVRNMESFLEETPREKKDKTGEEKKYTIQKGYDKTIATSSADYSNREEQNERFSDANLRRTIIFEDEFGAHRARKVIDPVVRGEEEFKESRLAKYEILTQHETELNKYKRRRR